MNQKARQAARTAVQNRLAEEAQRKANQDRRIKTAAMGAAETYATLGELHAKLGLHLRTLTEEGLTVADAAALVGMDVSEAKRFHRSAGSPDSSTD